MTGPKRIQRRRVKGYRMPKGARYVGRPGKWKNPFVVGKLCLDLFGSGEICTPELAVKWHRAWLTGKSNYYLMKDIAELRGHDLACWCGLCDAHKDGLPLGVKCPDCEPCHADLLLTMANRCAAMPGSR